MARSWSERSRPLGIRILTMKHCSARPTPPWPPVTPAPSPWVYTPHQRKYVPSHSGGMDWNPSRAKRRISSRPSHGFLERLRRSTLCALVSAAVIVIACCPPPVCPQKAKTHRQDDLAVGYKCRFYLN